MGDPMKALDKRLNDLQQRRRPGFVLPPSGAAEVASRRERGAKDSARRAQRAAGQSEPEPKLSPRRRRVRQGHEQQGVFDVAEGKYRPPEVLKRPQLPPARSLMRSPRMKGERRIEDAGRDWFAHVAEEESPTEPREEA